MDRGQTDVLVHQIFGQCGAGGVEVGVLQRMQEDLDGAGVFESLLGHDHQPSEPLWQGNAMRVAVVAGPDPGHSFPAIALCQRFVAAGDNAHPADRYRVAGNRSRRRCRCRRTGRARPHRGRRRPRRRCQNPPARGPDGGAEPAAASGDGAGPGGVRRHHRLRRDVGRAAGNPVDRTQPASAVPAVQRAAADRQRAGAGHRDPRPVAGCHDARADRPIRAGRRPPARRRCASRSVCRQPIPAHCAG